MCGKGEINNDERIEVKSREGWRNVVPFHAGPFRLFYSTSGLTYSTGAHGIPDADSAYLGSRKMR